MPRTAACGKDGCVCAAGDVFAAGCPRPRNVEGGHRAIVDAALTQDAELATAKLAEHRRLNHTHPADGRLPVGRGCARLVAASPAPGKGLPGRLMTCTTILSGMAGERKIG